MVTQAAATRAAVVDTLAVETVAATHAVEEVTRTAAVVATEAADMAVDTAKSRR
jgi:hypothetical protein